MQILAYDPVSEPPADVRCAGLGDLAARSDVISLHLPLTSETRHLIDDAFLAGVKPGAVLVNCSRGALIDTDAVFRALTAGRLSGVGLDVFDPEPPRPHPLYEHPDVVLTPHLMGLSRRATAATFTAAARGCWTCWPAVSRRPSPTRTGSLTSGPARCRSSGRAGLMTGSVTTDPLRVGVLGAARIADLAIVQPARLTGHRLVAVAARDHRRAEDFAQRHGVERALASYGDVLADDAVVNMQLVDDCYRAAGLSPRPAHQPLIKEIQP